MEQGHTAFFIAAKDCLAALEAVKAPCKKGIVHSWVDLQKVLEAPTFQKAIEGWRWEIEFDSEDNVIDIAFSREKYGDDDVLFKALAPFVRDGSYIEMRGGIDSHWRWLFKKGELISQEGNLSFNTLSQKEAEDRLKKISRDIVLHMGKTVFLKRDMREENYVAFFKEKDYGQFFGEGTTPLRAMKKLYKMVKEYK